MVHWLPRNGSSDLGRRKKNTVYLKYSYADLQARLDMAVEGSESKAMPGQAQKLVDALNSNRDYDMNNDWKVATLFIGANNLCQYCLNYPANSPEASIALRLILRV